MKKNMSSYLYALSESNYDILEEIFCYKYRKFRKIYWLLKEYSDFIVGLKYDDNPNRDYLKISIKFSGINTKDVVNNLQGHIEDMDNATIVNNKKDLFIEIMNNEGDA